MNAEDKNNFCQERIDAGITMTGQAFLERYSDGSLGELSPEETREHVEALYARGATDVLICEIDELEADVATSEHLLVELPPQADIRAGLFAYCATIETLSGCEPDTDSGQKHCYVWFD